MRTCHRSRRIVADSLRFRYRSLLEQQAESSFGELEASLGDSEASLGVLSGEPEA